MKDDLLFVVCAAGALAMAGVVLLAFVQTPAVLIVAAALALAATLTVLITTLAMVGRDESSPPARFERRTYDHPCPAPHC